jgi:hypothetical protein
MYAGLTAEMQKLNQTDINEIVIAIITKVLSNL